MKHKLSIILSIAALCLLTFYQSNGQFITNGSSNNFFGQPDNSSVSQSNWIRSVGVGYFGSNYTNSLLHVDGNNIILPQNGSINSEGEVFRTDAPSGATFWRLLREGDEYGIIYNDDDDHFYINAADGSGDLYLGNNAEPTAITIENGTGFVGIGTASPAYLLDVSGNMNLDTFNFYRIGGREALYLDTAQNVGVGIYHNMGTITTGYRNVIIGDRSGASITTGYQNSFLGTLAGQNLTTGENNVFFGECTGRATTEGLQNTYLGSFAGVASTDEGSFNTFIGHQSGGSLTVGSSNVLVGRNSGRGLTTSINNTQNVIIGTDAGFSGPGSMVTATRLTLLGNNAEAANNLTNAGAIGANAYVAASNSLVLGGFTGNGNGGTSTNVGIGTTTPNYRFQVHEVITATANYMQVGNNTSGNGVADGLLVGLNANGNGEIRQQENSPLIIQSDWDNTAGGIADGERMRITSIGAPGVPDPASAPDSNITRVAISHHGSNPITQPRSLLHLGYNVGQPLPSNDGWRNWMDVGMFVNQGSDNIYVGMKREADPVIVDDRFDAVIGWGDNQLAAIPPLNIGPDNLRFIFTSTNDLTGGDSISRSYNGLEVARLEPRLASTLNATDHAYGMMGIGNFAPGSFNDINATPVDAKLDIDGDLRIREVTEDTTLNMVLVIDTNDLNRVHWRLMDDFGGGVGNYCSEPQDTLSGHYEIPLNDYNYYFTGSQPYPDIMNNTNGVAIGLDCAESLLGKLHVRQDEGNFLAGGLWSVSGYFDNIGDDAFNGVALYGIAQGEKEIQNVGGAFEAYNGAKTNIGVNGFASSNTAGATTVNFGGYFRANGGDRNFGIYAEAGNDSVGDINNCAGLFSGDVITSGGYYAFSDENLKENIDPIQSAADILTQLNPVGYDFRYQEYTNMNLPREHQMGLIAQEVEQVLPEIVKEIIHPAKYDSLGNEISPPMELKGVNYAQLIPLLIAGFQEQQAKMVQKDVVINDLTQRLDALEICVREANLCGVTPPHHRLSGEEDPVGQAVKLKNLNAIILDQNLPNPFAEQTTISYLIPEEVKEAQLIF